jgi:hypothetical protein
MNRPPTPSASLVPPHAANEGPSGSSEAAALAQTDISQQATPPIQTPAAGGAASTHAASGRQGAADTAYALYSKPETLNSPPAHSVTPPSLPSSGLCTSFCVASCVLRPMRIVYCVQHSVSLINRPLLLLNGPCSLSRCSDSRAIVQGGQTSSHLSRLSSLSILVALPPLSVFSAISSAPGPRLIP